MNESERMGRHPARVLLFDSGVGGLSISRALRERLPGLALDYLVDNAFSPYGEKTESALRERLPLLLKAMVAKSGSDLVVVACNTASLAALPQIRALLDVPVVGTVPAIKPAASMSKSGVIGLLATPGTVTSAETGKLIEEHANGCQVISQGAAGLVRLAEAKLRGHSFSLDAVRQATSRLFSMPGGERMDCVVLGCTHFPLISKELEEVAPRTVTWLDSGEAIARRVEYLLEERSADCVQKSGPKRAFFTAWTPGLGQLRRSFEREGFTEMTWFADPQKRRARAA